ncbi:GreA/GreB family elongation factor [Chryseobacterium sp. C-71]|uniref:GreA/GreB family elongation factor n=1 Tax=Chryseobacterium sp. C-71 TaxID=2893882 RepID=UPI001E40B4DD|nr:GreA/GreB family elongation factor [Chryseobacterium sp. C-71]UFH33207.1 GreA/GreB family elongation factor [Chryseobacterium sp. C-71]
MNKENILQILKDKISEKIKTFENLIAETRASSNDTKSSMGDKYETGREMLQQEINNIQRQLNETLNQQNFVKKLNTEVCTKVQNGALVKTDKGFFYISVSSGEIVFEGKKIMTISSESPLAKAMFGKKIAETFIINNVNQVIEEIG